MRWRSHKVVVTIAVAAVASLGMAGCSAGSGSSDGTPLVIGTGGVLTENNNPFSPTSSGTAQGWAWLIYEPLVQSNAVDPEAEPTPWLAESFEWSEDFTQVSFTTRDGVKWSDGEDFTVDDVAFTFNLIKGNEALNSGNIPYGDITVDGNTVTVGFESSQFVNQAKITGQFIVPEHIWADVDDPAAYTDEEPVGTGPFTFDSATSTVGRLLKNESYWQADQVQPSEVVYRALQGNDAIINALVSYDVDWAGAAALNQKAGFVDKNPKKNFAWNAPGLGMSALWLNISKKPFDSVELRRAVSMVIDRERANKLASADLTVPITSVTGLSEPTGTPFISEEFAGQNVEVDVDGAIAELEAGGFTLTDGVLLDPTGTPVTMTLIDPSGWTDYLTALQVIVEDLTKIGIAATIETPSQDAWGAALASGEFDATIRYTNSGATPFDTYSTFMDGNQLVPVGEQANANFARFDSPEATEALTAYANATDEALRAAALATVQRVFVEQVPVIPVMSNSTIGEFTTQNWTGWPSADDPYASPSFLSTNISLILTTLEASK